MHPPGIRVSNYAIDVSVTPGSASIYGLRALMKKKYRIRLSAEQRRHLTDLIRKGKVAAWAASRNQVGNTVDWRFTTEDARTKLKTLYPCTGKDQAMLDIAC